MKEKIEQLMAAPRIPAIKGVSLSVYVLYRENVPVYVGSSANVDARIQQHIASDKDFDSYAVINVGTVEEMHELEIRCIAKLAPEYNASFAGTTKSGFESMEMLKRRYSMGTLALRKFIAKANIEILYFRGSAYYNVRQLDVLLGDSQ